MCPALSVQTPQELVRLLSSGYSMCFAQQARDAAVMELRSTLMQLPPTDWIQSKVSRTMPCGTQDCHSMHVQGCVPQAVCPGRHLDSNPLSSSLPNRSCHHLSWTLIIPSSPSQ